MASDSPVSLTQHCVPVFKGEEYGRWSLRMKTVFQSQDLWDLVESGMPKGEDEAKAKESKKRDAKARCLIQQAVDGLVLDRIAEAETAHQAWEIIKRQHEGSSKMVSVRKQALRQSFETLQMEDNESVQSYWARVVTIVNQVRGLGHKLSEAEVVSKVLRSLAPKFDYVAVAMEESRDLSTLTLDELCGSLQAHEFRVNRLSGKANEKALFVKGDTSSSQTKEKGSSTSSTGWSPTRGRGRGPSVERGVSPERKELTGSRGTEIMNVLKASVDDVPTTNSIWLVDSGCSSHMTGQRSMFTSLDESQKITVRLGDDKEMKEMLDLLPEKQGRGFQLFQKIPCNGGEGDRKETESIKK
ncbi:uncharacterized protein LOC120273134 [Dioscorea cayenensis subsp. rotundata]|uniref:Uncharacterized protein LOC120273134 n=1 Tax=Dioscorea cayennensis subsp. rotundata TaxID=55577 RepID=A0AB40C8M0_DIOCR|nr:uncharacterized protein LOC120273134 [Dioscorea cayenensis subsp. rotundata]